MANAILEGLYAELGNLLKQDDRVFIEKAPNALRTALSKPGFLEGVSTLPAPKGKYTRKKIIGEPGKHIIRFMEWAPGCDIPPHGHHSRPCIEILVEGDLRVIDWQVEKFKDTDLFVLRKKSRYSLIPGQVGIIDPKVTDVHSILAVQRTKSLHVYPVDYPTTFVYIVNPSTSLYEKRKFELKQE